MLANVADKLLSLWKIKKLLFVAPLQSGPMMKYNKQLKEPFQSFLSGLLRAAGVSL